MTRAYYNEIDPAAAYVLRELISRDVIAPGDVDDRSIKDVKPDDLRGYTQCHFFAGAGLWSVAARLAGWPDDRPLWTGSCPCQPFSAAGKGLGADDPRHLWPDFHHLIRSARPPVVMGEQVAGKAGYGWFDGVRADLAGEAYAARAVDIPASAIDAPHQRNRLYWIAMGDGSGERRSQAIREPGNYAAASVENATDSAQRTYGADRLFSHAAGERRGEGRPEHEFRSGRHAVASADVQLQPDPDCGGRDGRQEITERGQKQRAASEWADGGILTDSGRDLRGSGPGLSQDRQISSNANGRNGSWWADAEWIVSPLDDKARRTKPGLPFLVDGLVGRTDLWRLCGNSIVAVLAAEVIAAFLDAEMTERRTQLLPSQSEDDAARRADE